jgi:8-oxo-dGTP diphosphatase
MSYNNLYRVSCHAVIFNDQNEVLLLKQTYSDKRWGLPGGSPEQSEDIYQTLNRECEEELGCKIMVHYLSGIYYHSEFNSYVFIFRCDLTSKKIVLSEEHSEYGFFSIASLQDVQRLRVEDCLNFEGNVFSRSFH